eukprot:GHVH01007600.1.p1 GENE.GHVH01007600.1~~GHVH01007600.1.p1  ORF type:complete len:235 (+),score=26.07 GHVH01007600.1:121-825(+)
MHNFRLDHIIEKIRSGESDGSLGPAVERLQQRPIAPYDPTAQPVQTPSQQRLMHVGHQMPNLYSLPHGSTGSTMKMEDPPTAMRLIAPRLPPVVGPYLPPYHAFEGRDYANPMDPSPCIGNHLAAISPGQQVGQTEYPSGLTLHPQVHPQHQPPRPSENKTLIDSLKNELHSTLSDLMKRVNEVTTMCNQIEDDIIELQGLSAESDEDNGVQSTPKAYSVDNGLNDQDTTATPN